MYYYRLVNDSLLQLGHENPSVLLEYTHPMMLMHFPLNYGLTVFSLDDEVAAAGGFVTALVVVILVVAIAGRVVRKVFHFAGLGVADTLLGIAVSVLKYLLVLSVLFSAFDALNEDYCLVGPRTIEQSKSYKPVRWLSESIFPFLEWVGERVPRQEEKTETDG